ncbi:MAG: response regulator [Verrucomicrobiota bacterium]
MVREREIASGFKQQSHAEGNLLSLGEFAGKFSHDLGNVLEVVHANLEYVLSEKSNNLTHDQRQSLQDALDACATGAAVSHQLLGYARKQSYDAKELSLRELILDVVNLCSYSFESGFEFILDEVLAERDILVHASYSILGYSLVTVLKDVREALVTDGRIFIQVDTDEYFSHIFVTEETGGLLRLKEGETGTQDSSNVSLDVVHGVLEKQGGALTIQGDSEFGASIVISIPLSSSQPLGNADQYQQDTNALQEKQEDNLDKENQMKVGAPKRHFLRKTQPVNFKDFRESATSAQELQKMSVMVVDDDALVNRSLGRLMNRIGFGEVEATTNPLEALDKVRSGFLPEWFFVDYSMPEMNGLEFLEHLSEFREQQSFVKDWYPQFVLISAYPPDELKKLIGKSRLEKLTTLTKPFTIETIRNLVEAPSKADLHNKPIIRLSTTNTEKRKTACFFGTFGSSP